MLPKNARKALLSAAAGITIAVAATPHVLASGPALHLSHRCKGSCAIFESPFFGYYPTCWRRFPPGQPPCPPSAAWGAEILPAQPLAEPERLAAPKVKNQKEEVLPKPMPDKKPKL
jgi:hypothetical protein